MTTRDRRQFCVPAEVEQALLALDTTGARVRATVWPAGLQNLDNSGLYSWWVDKEGAADLSSGLGLPVKAGRIYAGQTGATKWPSGKTGAMTLSARIGSNHLRGSTYGSTFRRTLAACLLDVLSLEVTSPKKLSPESEKRLSGWMARHLSVAANPFEERDALMDLESRVLAVLDPPLNLDSMDVTTVRSRLSILRRQLSPDAPGLHADLPETEPAPRQPRRSRELEQSVPSGPSSGVSLRVTLHEELVDILSNAQTEWLTTTELAAAVNARGRYCKKDGTPVTAFQVHGRTRNYGHLFERRASSVRLAQHH